jgi:hypothetical protein
VRAREIESRLKDLQVLLTGDSTVASRSEPTPPSITERVGRIVGGQWTSTSPPTQTNLDAYRHAADEFTPLLAQLTALVETDLAALESAMESAGAPWTPGRLPRWTRE